MNCNNKGRVASDCGGVDVSAQLQDVLHAGRIPAAYRVVEEAVFTGVLGVNVLSFQGLLETTKVFSGKEREDVVPFQLRICRVKWRLELQRSHNCN